MDTLEAFKILGFRENDRINAARKNTVEGYKPREMRLIDYINNLDSLSNSNCYFSCSTIFGGICKTDCVEIVELVVDIDYGPHHRRMGLATKEDALTAAKMLPLSTMIVHTGGGFQVHYRLKERLPAAKNTEMFEETTKKMCLLTGGDSCNMVCHVYRVPFTNNVKDGAPVRPVTLEEVHPEVEYDLKWLANWAQNHCPKQKERAKKIARKKSKIKHIKREHHGISRSEQCFRFIERELNKNHKLSERSLLARIKGKPFYEHYVDVGQDKDNAAVLCRADIRRIRQKLTYGKMPRPQNEVITVKYQNEQPSEPVLAQRKLFNQLVFNTDNNSRQTIALTLMEQLFLDNKKAILDFPCTLR